MPQYLMDESLYAEELRIEKTARSRGVARYRRLAEQAIYRGDGAQLKAAERLLAHWFTPLRNLISAEKKAISEGRPAKHRGDYGPTLLTLDSDAAAVIVMHEVLSILMQEPSGVSRQKLCMAIGNALNGEVNYHVIVKKRKTSPEIWDALTKTDRTRITATNCNKIAARHMPGSRWRLKLKARLGGCLLEKLLRVAILSDYREKDREEAFKLNRRPFRGHTQYFVTLTPKAAEVIEQGHRHRSTLQPVYQPMVVPPMVWAEDTHGGYLELPTTIVKRMARHKTGARDNETVREALNCINAAPWQVDPWILDIAQTLADFGGACGGIPRQNELPMPPRPGDFDTNEKAKKLWKRDASRRHRENCNVRAERRVFQIKVQTAAKFADRKAIYFPHQLDFTGRFYPIPAVFNHQGDDLCRGLLRFAEDEAAEGHDAQWWLRVHMANCCGVDKVSFAKRIEWVQQNLETLDGWVADPYGNTGWMEADKPFQALAAARALLDEDAAAKLIVQIDGSNNAIQHYAAMMRCRETAEMVNLTPGDHPQDLYSRVADVAARIIGKDADGGNQHAAKLEGWVNRKIIKQVVMTTGYGVTAVGARRQVYGTLKDAGFDVDSLYEASKYLGRIAMEATSDVCPAASAAMDWMRACSKIITDSGEVVRWDGALGMEVEQPYRKTSTARVTTLMGRMNFREAADDAKPAAARQINGTAPNFVHNIDAAHAKAVAIDAYDHNIRLALVHDSFGTHAAHMSTLATIVRDQFVLIHEEPLLQRLYEDFSGRYGLDFPAPPFVGDFDLSEVHKALYSFA